MVDLIISRIITASLHFEFFLSSLAIKHILVTIKSNNAEILIGTRFIHFDTSSLVL